MDVSLAHLLEFGEGNMAAATFRTPVTGEAQIHAKTVKVGGAICVIAPEFPADSRYNVVLGLGVNQAATKEMVAEIISHYREAGAPGFTIGMSPLATPTEIPDWFGSLGLKHVVNIAKFYRDLYSVPVLKNDMNVQMVGAEHADAFADITCAVSNLPPGAKSWIAAQVGATGYHFLAFDGDTPVAAAALYAQDGIASLHMAATLPSHRGRGAQKALQIARLQFASELGCKWAVTETPEEKPGAVNPSYRNMIRTGFRLGYIRPHYLWLNEA